MVESAASDRCQVGVKSWVLNCLLEWLRSFVEAFGFERGLDGLRGMKDQTIDSDRAPYHPLTSSPARARALI